MNKILETIKSYLPATLISILTIRAAVLGASLGDAIAILALSSLYGYKLYLNNKAAIDINADVLKELEKMKGELSNVSIAVSQRPKNAPLQFKF